MDKERNRMKGNPFTVPDGFFDDQRKAILKNTVEKDEVNPTMRSNRKKLAWTLSTIGIAASLLILVYLGPLSDNVGTSSDLILNDPELLAMETDPYWLLDIYGAEVLPEVSSPEMTDSLLIWELNTYPLTDLTIDYSDL